MATIANAPRCSGLNTDGSRCSKATRSVSGFCYRHVAQSQGAPSLNVPAATATATATAMDHDEDSDCVEDCDDDSSTTGLGTTNKRVRFDPTHTGVTRPSPTPTRMTPPTPPCMTPINGMASGVRSTQGENYALREGIKMTAVCSRGLLRRYAEARAKHAEDRERLQTDIADLRRQVDDTARRGVSRDMTVEEKAAIDEGLRDLNGAFGAAMEALDSFTFDELCAFDPLDQFTRRFGDISLGGSRQK